MSTKHDTNSPTRLVVAMTGATGAALGIRLLEVLAELNVETHLVLSDWARATINLETEHTVDEVRALAAHTYSARDLAAGIFSGSFLTGRSTGSASPTSTMCDENC